MDESEVESYWIRARSQARLTSLPGYLPQNTIEMVPPPAWSFGGTPDQADTLLSLVLDGRKTATASALRDYETEGEALPEPGTLGIVLDGAGHPRALIETTEVSVVPFDQVPAEHAEAEGEGTLAEWREAHEAFFRSTGGAEVTPDLPVVLERFRVLHRA